MLTLVLPLPSVLTLRQVLRQLFPQFAQQGPRGGFMQQDAEELYSSVVNTLSQTLKEVSGFDVGGLRAPWYTVVGCGVVTCLALLWRTSFVGGSAVSPLLWCCVANISGAVNIPN